MKKLTKKEKYFLNILFDEISYTTWDCRLSQEQLTMCKKLYPEAIITKTFNKHKTEMVRFSLIDPKKYIDVYIENLKEKAEMYSKALFDLQKQLYKLSEM